MSTYIAKHEGGRAQIIRLKGGESLTLKSGQSVPIELDSALTAAQIAHYSERGVKFVADPDGRASKKVAAEKKATADKKAAAIATAEKEVADAKELVEAAADDAAKTEAAALLADAEAKLAALKA